MAKKQVWPKYILNKKDACHDFMKNGPDGASRSLTKSPFLQKNMFDKKDARRDFMKNGPDGVSRSLMRSPFLQKNMFNNLSSHNIPYIRYIPYIRNLM